MKKRYYLLLIVIFGALGYYVYRERSLIQFLGKAPLSKPPKMRIVYSRKQKDSERTKIVSSYDVIEVLRKVWSSQIQTREEFVVLYLDNSNRVLGYDKTSKGGISATVVDVKLITATALESLASSIILAHNHPSGNLKPSQADIALTKKIVNATQTMSISVLDHIILTKDGSYSFSDNGLI